MNERRADPSSSLELAGTKPSGGGWSHNRWLTFVVIALAAHVALIFAFGGRKPIVPRPVTNVPHLSLANPTDELLALNDPTLFALPNARGFASAAWQQRPFVTPPSFRWTEPPRWLRLPDDELGATFNQFIQTNRFAGPTLQFKPPPELSRPESPVQPEFAPTSTLQLAGGLVQRQLRNTANLPSLPYTNVIAPSVVQVLVNPAGHVVSAILLPPFDSLETDSHYNVADQRALALARAAQFLPAPELTLGRLIFNWRTVPPTNSPAATNEHK
jgi:hypothetical protein